MAAWRCEISVLVWSLLEEKFCTSALSRYEISVRSESETEFEGKFPSSCTALLLPSRFSFSFLFGKSTLCAK